MWNVTLADCVQWAYGVEPFQITGAHTSDEVYDILAKTESPVAVSQLRIKLQNLLAERFRLVLHHETRMLPAYELVIAKGGPKVPQPHDGASQPAVHSAESLPRVENDSFVFAEVSMAEFARMFGQLRGIDLPVVDHTGIAGTYDLVLKSAPSVAREGDRGGLFAIVQEQLGLRLAGVKAPFDVLVIDRAEKPGRN